MNSFFLFFFYFMSDKKLPPSSDFPQKEHFTSADYVRYHDALRRINSHNLNDLRTDPLAPPFDDPPHTNETPEAQPESFRAGTLEYVERRDPRLVQLRANKVQWLIAHLQEEIKDLWVLWREAKRNKDEEGKQKHLELIQMKQGLVRHWETELKKIYFIK